MFFTLLNYFFDQRPDLLTNKTSITDKLVMKRTQFIIISLSIFALLASCAPINRTVSSSSKMSSTNDSQQTTTTPNDPASGSDPATSQVFCTKMSLANIKWPTSVGKDLWPTYFALTLNLTGSYEGHEGWINISNNGDRQGLSLGLMQQNLGQGTLQPLLIKMFQLDHNTVLKNFSTPDYTSLRTMLEEWQNGSLQPNPQMVQLRNLASEELFPDVEYFNEMDAGYVHFTTLSVGSTVSGVQWAINNLYNGNSFIPRWKKSLQDTAMSSTYRSLQVEAASNMFIQAKKYVTFFDFKQLRSLLFLYDVVVQNGGFSASNKTSYLNWLSKNPSASEFQRLLALRDILVARLTTANPNIKKDVYDRKTSVIMGSGTVHGETRNYPKEYCYNPLRTIF